MRAITDTFDSGTGGKSRRGAINATPQNSRRAPYTDTSGQVRTFCWWGWCAAATPRSEEQAACRVRLRLKRKSKESFIELIPLLQVAWSYSGTGGKESARGYQCYTVKFPQSALYRYLRSGAVRTCCWWGCAAATPRSEEQAACRVRLRLKRKSNSSIGWVMLWSTPDAQTSSTLAHTPAVASPPATHPQLQNVDLTESKGVSPPEVTG
jgi:hypothetical protein